jgi:hypothetical protein
LNGGDTFSTKRQRQRVMRGLKMKDSKKIRTHFVVEHEHGFWSMNDLYQSLYQQMGLELSVKVREKK